MSPVLGWMNVGWLESLNSARSLGIALWIGLGVLTVALFILGRTRWGQAQPLSKCVVLSIFVHVLLGAYAYGTKLILDAPLPPGDDPIHVTMLAAGEPLESERERESRDHPWDEFVTNADVRPDVTGPAPRAAVESRAERETADTTMSPRVDPSTVTARTWTMPAPPRPAVETPGLEALQVQRPAAVRTPIEAAPVQPRERVAAVGPEGASLPRPSQREAIATTPERQRASLPDPQAADDARLQALADVVRSSDRSDVTSGDDRLAEASNREDGRKQMRDGTSPAEPGPRDSQAAQHDGSPDHAANAAGASRQRNVAQPATTAAGPPLRLGDGKALPDPYHARLADDRLAVARRYGGNERTEAAVQAGLAWLASVQANDGRWEPARFGAGRETSVLGHNRDGAGARADTGISGLAILAFLGAGHTHLEGKYRLNVQRGLEFLLRSQRADGSLAGDAELFAMMYCHGIASLALNEAYAMTGDHRLQPFVEAAVAYCIASQNPTSGGWRYQPGDRGDMSQFGWQVMALKSAELGGKEIPELTRGSMVRFLRSVHGGRHQGLASYRPGEHASVTMTAESLVCRLMLRTDLDREQVHEAVEYLMQDLPVDGKPNLYYWYYATVALFQLQGEPWDRWNVRLQEQLLRRQVKEGREAGSWSADTVWGGYGGRIYSTALATLCLEVYYRYLPIYGVEYQPEIARQPRWNGLYPR